MATKAGYIFAQFGLQPGGDWRNSTANIKTKPDITISPHKAQGHPGLRYLVHCQKGYICYGTIQEFTLNFAVRVELVLLSMLLVSRSMDLWKITCICYLCSIDELSFVYCETLSVCNKTTTCSWRDMTFCNKRSNYFKVLIRID